jgi:hypothetical protein
MNAEELDADRYQEAGERFALNIDNNMSSESHIEDLNARISNLIPGIQTYIKNVMRLAGVGTKGTRIQQINLEEVAVKRW